MKEDLADEEIQEAKTEIQKFLSRSIDVVDITAVESEEVFERTGAGTETGAYDCCFRVKVSQPDESGILDSWANMTAHIRHQLESMEQNSDAPDTILLAEDHPPEHLVNQPLVYYLQSTL